MPQMEIYMPRQLLTIQEVADQLRTSTFTVLRWLREGTLPGVKIGREWRIDPTDLEDFIRRGKQSHKDD